MRLDTTGDALRRVLTKLFGAKATDAPATPGADNPFKIGPAGMPYMPRKGSPTDLMAGLLASRVLEDLSGHSGMSRELLTKALTLALHAAVLSPQTKTFFKLTRHDRDRADNPDAEFISAHAKEELNGLLDTLVSAFELMHEGWWEHMMTVAKENHLRRTRGAGKTPH